MAIFSVRHNSIAIVAGYNESNFNFFTIYYDQLNNLLEYELSDFIDKNPELIKINRQDYRHDTIHQHDQFKKEPGLHHVHLICNNGFNIAAFLEILTLIAQHGKKSLGKDIDSTQWANTTKYSFSQWFATANPPANLHFDENRNFNLRSFI